MEASTLAPSQTRRLPLPLSRLSDETLARLVRRGDEAAFTMLYRRYHQPLYRYCRSILRDDSDAQDALQSTFTGALKALRCAERDAPLRPWLFRIAHNESISLLRRRRPASELPEQMAGGEPPLEERAAQRERLSQLMADLRELPDRQRSALIMRELNDLSHEEIAAALDTTTGTAKQAIFEARRSLVELEAGRATPCEEICRIVSDGDRRALRGKRVRSHLRACRECSAFAGAIETRSAELRALTPVLPAGAAASVLAHVLGGGGGGAAAGTGGAAAGSAATGAGAAGKAAVGIAILKPVAGAALLATAAVGTTEVVVHHHGRRAGERLVQAREASAAPAVLAAVSDGPAFMPISAGGTAAGAAGGSLAAGGNPATQGQTVVVSGRGSARRRGARGAGGAGSIHGSPPARSRAAGHSTGKARATYVSRGSQGRRHMASPGSRRPVTSGAASGKAGTPRSSTGVARSQSSSPPVPAAKSGLSTPGLGTAKSSTSRLTTMPGALPVTVPQPARPTLPGPASGSPRN